jgi:hypothetical protein
MSVDRDVVDSAETLVNLAFYSDPRETGTLVITSNIDAYIVVEAGGVQIASTYGKDLLLDGMKLGTYLVTASPEDSDYGNSKSTYLTLSTDGETVPYSFVFEVTQLPWDPLALLILWAPLILVCVGLLLIFLL